MKRLIAVVALGAAVLLVPIWAAATPPRVAEGWAYVDGLYGEWNLITDFFANMYRAGTPTKLLESKLYLRYSCKTMKMYALVIVEPGHVGYIDPVSVTSWIAINSLNSKVVNQNTGNNGIAPDFAWVGRGFDGNQAHVLGYEASFPITMGSYIILAHLAIWDISAQTSSTIGLPGSGPALMVPDCSVGVESSTWGAVKELYR